jgi:GR25 family glycosyltransferase involved in LPS biosynthesis
MTLNDYFDGIYCVNLARRQDRWNECVKLFDKHNLNVERVDAKDWKTIQWIDPSLGEKYIANVANLMSVIKVLNLAGNKGYKKILLLEDDVDFVDNLNEKFFQNVESLPNDWGFLYLGGNHEGGYTDIVYEDGTLSPLIKCNRTYALQSFGFTGRVAPYIWKKLSEILFMASSNPRTKIREHAICADYWIGEMQATTPTYSFREPLSWQRNDYSDIEQKDSNYEWLKYKL